MGTQSGGGEKRKKRKRGKPRRGSVKTRVNKLIGG